MTFEQEISEILKPMQPRKGSGVKFSEVVASIKEAIERHVIGEDEDIPYDPNLDHDFVADRNRAELRAEQLERLHKAHS